MMIREELKNLTEKAIKKLYEIEPARNASPARQPDGSHGGGHGDAGGVKIDHSPNPAFGDYSTNVAMLIKKNPQEIIEAIKAQISKSKFQIMEKVEVKNGFINFFIAKEYLQKEVGDILKQKDRYGTMNSSKSAEFKRVNVEFISANPTGPLTLGNGRGGFCGDVLASVLQKAGYEVTREYYVNDAGEQVRKLGHSVLGDAEAVYQGQYIEELKTRFNSESTKEAEKIGEKAARVILEEMIKPSVKKMGISFDVWFSEKKLHEKKEVSKCLEFLKKKDLAYEKEGALWFRSTQFSDDKDRVLVKENGEMTYLASDIAYLKNKFERGFDKLIFFWGADHYGYIERLKAAAQALGYKREQIDILIMQLVKLFKDGQEFRMSKRAGIYVTLDELINEVGLDAARFFFLSRSSNSQFDFDMNLAKEKSDKNPVYYVQYASARINSILAKCKIQKSKFKIISQNLKEPSELNLIKQLVRWPEVIEDTAKDYQVQRLPQYATDLATVFSAFYRDCQVINEDGSANQARLSLVLAIKIVLENTLKLMGISAPEKM
jgi:arginyl-tRNA synthetase